MEAVASSMLSPKLDYPVKEREESLREHFTSNVSEDLVVIECVEWRPSRQRRRSGSPVRVRGKDQLRTLHVERLRRFCRH